MTGRRRRGTASGPDTVAHAARGSRGAEVARVDEARARTAHWKRWGPYLAERQWGTVREDYSEAGTPWQYFPHDHARSRVYRFGEDGLLGISDNHQRLCFAWAFWNERDTILKERLFGLSGPEGNHGEDVKEYYFYVDCTPTHSYMKALYKYLQRAFPYAELVEESARRSRRQPEYELLDTGIFDDDRYFDITVEYAKAAPNDVLIRLTVVNRGPEPAPLHVHVHTVVGHASSEAGRCGRRQARSEAAGPLARRHRRGRRPRPGGGTTLVVPRWSSPGPPPSGRTASS